MPRNAADVAIARLRDTLGRYEDGTVVRTARRFFTSEFLAFYESVASSPLYFDGFVRAVRAHFAFAGVGVPYDRARR